MSHSLASSSSTSPPAPGQSQQQQRSSADAPRQRRSRSGCLTCRRRRKRCPEDFRLDAHSGRMMCSTCVVRGVTCVPAPRMSVSSFAGMYAHLSPPHHPQQQQQQQHNHYVAPPPPPPPQLHSSPPTYSHLHPSPHPAPSVFSPASHHTGSISSGSRMLVDQQQTHDGSPFDMATAATNTSTATSAMTSAQPNTNAPPRPSVEDHSWLDNFLEEFIELTDATVPSGGHVDPSTLAPPSIVTPIVAAPAATAAAAAAAPTPTHARPPLSEQSQYDMLIERSIHSEDLNELLHRWSSIYAAFLSAIIDTSAAAGEETLLACLFKFVGMADICKASMVSCCLAYYEAMTRTSSSRKDCRFDRYVMERGMLDGGAPRPVRDMKIANRLARAWLRYSIDGYVQVKNSIPLPAKMLSLFNIRTASVTLLGAKEAMALAPEIQEALQALHVDMVFLADTYKTASPLSVVVQGLMVAHIMDSAIVHGMRPVILAGRRDDAQPTKLWHDLKTSEKVEIQVISALSIGQISVLKDMSDLVVDIKQGDVDDATIRRRAKALQSSIMTDVANIPKYQLDATARLRIFILHDMWRQSLLIRLYQDVFRLGPMASRLQHALEQIIKYAKMLPAGEGDRRNLPDEWDMAMVWILACTVALSSEQRALCLAKLESLGPERAIDDDVDAIKSLWREMDDTGRVTDWRATLAEQGHVISYTF